MGAASTGWTVTFRGCEQTDDDCDAAWFEAAAPQGDVLEVEVRTTAQIEQILARELGKSNLERGDREAILSVAGRQAIDEALAERGEVSSRLYLDSRLFRTPGAGRRLLRECGLLTG